MIPGAALGSTSARSVDWVAAGARDSLVPMANGRNPLDRLHDPVLIRGMENHSLLGSKGPSRRTFLSASAVTAVAAVPVVSVIAPASAASAKVGSAATSGNVDPALQALISRIDASRIQATIQTLVGFGTRQTQSSQTD